MNSHPLKGPLILIAAAIIWNGSGVFHAGGKRDYDGYAIAGCIAAGVLLIAGLTISCANHQRRDD